MSLKFYLFLLLVISVTSYKTSDDPRDDVTVKSRTKRGAFWDFFSKVVQTGNLAFDQYNDTKVTLNEIYDLVSDGFSDGKPTKRPRTTTTTSTTPSPDTMMGDNTTLAPPTTTTEKYRISRYELGRIVGRNLRGLKRLLRIELNDALNQSHYNIAGYQREAQMVFSNSIIAEKKGAIKGIPPLAGNMTAGNMTAGNATAMTNSTRT